MNLFKQYEPSPDVIPVSTPQLRVLSNYSHEILLGVTHSFGLVQIFWVYELNSCGIISVGTESYALPM